MMEPARITESTRQSRPDTPFATYMRNYSNHIGPFLARANIDSDTLMLLYGLGPDQISHLGQRGDTLGRLGRGLIRTHYNQEDLNDLNRRPAVLNATQKHWESVPSILPDTRNIFPPTPQTGWTCLPRALFDATHQLSQKAGIPHLFIDYATTEAFLKSLMGTTTKDERYLLNPYNAKAAIDVYRQYSSNSQYKALACLDPLLLTISMQQTHGIAIAREPVSNHMYTLQSMFKDSTFEGNFYKGINFIVGDSLTGTTQVMSLENVYNNFLHVTEPVVTVVFTQSKDLPETNTDVIENIKNLLHEDENGTFTTESSKEKYEIALAFLFQQTEQIQNLYATAKERLKDNEPTNTTYIRAVKGTTVLFGPQNIIDPDVILNPKEFDSFYLIHLINKRSEVIEKRLQTIEEEDGYTYEGEVETPVEWDACKIEINDIRKGGFIRCEAKTSSVDGKTEKISLSIAKKLTGESGKSYSSTYKPQEASITVRTDSNRTNAVQILEFANGILSDKETLINLTD